MATVTDVFVKGSVENIIFYRRMGKSCSRIKRSGIKQTEATKMRGINFGVAARAGKGLRSGLLNVMPFPTDRSMQSRLAGAIAKWLGRSRVDDLPSTDEAPYIGTFSFVTGREFSGRFKATLAVARPQENLITVSIGAFVPSLQISAPARTVSVTLILSVAGCLMKSGWATGSETHKIEIPYNHIEIPAQTLEFHIPTTAESLTVTAVQLVYNEMVNNQLSKINNTAFTPAGIINARYIGK
jgi:hypothetical protein